MNVTQDVPNVQDLLKVVTNVLVIEFLIHLHVHVNMVGPKLTTIVKNVIGNV